MGHPVAENPNDRMFDAMYAHYGLPWQFWKNDIANTDDLALAVKALQTLRYKGMAIMVRWKVGGVRCWVIYAQQAPDCSSASPIRFQGCRART